MRALFGFVIEGVPRDGDVDAAAVPLHGFRVEDPSGREQAEREARMAESVSRMAPPRHYRVGGDGVMHEVETD